MKYIFYSITSMPCETDLDKAKREFSSLGEVEEYNEIYKFAGFKISNVYNDKIFLEQFNQSIHFKFNIYILKCAFIFVNYEFDVDESIPFIELFE